MNQLNQNQLQQHITILSWVLIVGHALFLLIGLFVFLLLGGIGAASGDRQAVVILGTVGTFVAGLLTVLGLPGIIAGFGLLRRHQWARYLAIVVGIFNLVNFPVGTLVGAYTLWVLFQESANVYFAQPLAS